MEIKPKLDFETIYGIGFALLTKLGYIPGRGLGKELQGRLEPIRITESRRPNEGIGFDIFRYDPDVHITQTMKASYQCNDKTLNEEGCGMRFSTLKDLRKHLMWKRIYEHQDMTCGGETKHSPVPDDCIISTIGPAFEVKASGLGEYFED